MSVLKAEQFLHPLTDKWMPLINRFAGRYDKPVRDLMQEALILEWQIQKNKKFESDKHKENYFKKALYRNLYRRVNSYPHEWGIMESGHNIKFHKDKEVVDEYGKVPNYDREDQISFVDSDNIVDIVDSFIQLRPFDEIYYDELVTHTIAILSQKSNFAAMIFYDRLKLQLRWKDLRLQQYKDANPYVFYKAVKLIRSVVRKEVAFS